MNTLAAGLVLAVVAVAGIAAYALSAPGAPAPLLTGTTSTSTTSFTQVTNETQPSCGHLVKTVSFQGYAIQTFLSSTSTRMGDVLCVNAVLINEGGRNVTLGTDEGLAISYNITGPGGAVVFSKNCTPGASGSSSSNATDSTFVIVSWSCNSFWQTGLANHGVLPHPGTYDIVVNAAIPNEMVQGFTLVGSTVTMKLLA